MNGAEPQHPGGMDQKPWGPRVVLTALALSDAHSDIHECLLSGSHPPSSGHF